MEQRLHRELWNYFKDININQKLYTAILKWTNFVLEVKREEEIETSILKNK